MAQIDELLEQAEAQESADSWVLITKYQRKEFYVDSDRAVNVAGRKIEAIKEDISVQGENHSQYIEFIMDRYYDGIDISEQTLAIHYEVGDASDEDAPINVYKNDTQIKFGWVVESSLTQHATTVEFCIWARGTLADGNAYVLKTLPQKYEIQRGLMIAGGIIEPSNNWYIQFALTMDEKVSQASESADRAVQAASSVDGVVEIVTTARDEVVQKSSTVNTQHSEVESWRQEVEQFRNEAEQFRDEAFTITPDSYAEVVKNVEKNTIKIDTIIEKAELNIKNSASGDNLHLTDSANSKAVEFGLYGKAEQKQYSGKNLVDGIDLQCLASDIAEKTITNAVHLTVGTYTLSWVQSATLTGNVTRNTPTIKIMGNESSKNYQDITPKRNLNAGRYYWTLKITEENDYVFGYWMHSPGVDVTISNIQLESGSVMTDFEPFTNGASPNPDYPQEITVAGASGSVEVVSCGKNLLENTAESKTVNGVTFTVNNDGSVTANGTATSDATFNVNSSFVFKTGTMYTISGCPSGGAYKKYVMHAFGVNVADYGNSVDITPSEDTTGRISLIIYGGNTVSDLTFYPMIRKASDTDDTFEPYKETTSTIPTPNGLCGIKVSSGGNYTDENGQQWITDEIVKYADGSGKRVQRIASVDMGTMNWEYASPYFKAKDLVGVVKEPSDNTKYSNALSTCFVVKNYTYLTENNNGLSVVYSSSASHGQIWCKADDYTDTTSFLEMVSGQYLYYELAEPIITDLTAEEIAEIEKLHTFYPVTNISNDADCGMSITYMADAKRYIDQRLALIESAMLNNI